MNFWRILFLICKDARMGLITATEKEEEEEEKEDEEEEEEDA